MVVDTSALIAIIGNEPEKERFLQLMVSARRVYIPAACLVEAYLVLARRMSHVEAERDLRAVIVAARGEIVAADQEIAFIAIGAAARYRKGTHRAGLNFGDLLSYATAKKLNLPLLFKGNDFGMTDVAFLQ